MIQNNFESQNNSEVQKLETPSLIQTRQGVSVLYKGKYLYSKYDPSKSILNIINNLSIPTHSLILVFSPTLWLGLNELIKKLSPDSTVVFFEFDESLYNFSLQNFPKEFYNSNFSKIKFYNKSNINDFFNFVQKANFRKTIKIEFSAGAALYKTEYENIFLLTQRIIDQFWKNRLTLIKFGRLYSKNIFKNLKLLPQSIPLEQFYKKVDSPIIVLGAGESVDSIIPLLKTFQEHFFIIAVDAIASTLLDFEIIPDAIIAVEGQLAIEKSYIGKVANSKILLIMDAASRNHIPYITKGNFSFFVSKYADINFFQNLSSCNILPPVILPLGSVGLVAMQIALSLRKNDNTKIYFAGLDFSFSPGITHAKGTLAHKTSLINTNKLISIFNFNAAFQEGTYYIKSKDLSKMITSKVLASYSLLFIDHFSKEKNIFDIGNKGIDLLTEKIDFKNVINSCEKLNKKNPLLSNSFFTEKENVIKFLTQEKNALQDLKDLFINGNGSKLRNSKISLNVQINLLLENREYLYIHFPDAVSKGNIQSFYNRIRIELDFFLKEINLALK